MTIRDIAIVLDVPYCWGMLPTGHYCHLDHTYGDIVLGQVHLADKPVRTRADTKRFLVLAAQVTDPSINDDIPWRRVYRLSRLARELGDRAGVRLPASSWKHDRAFVLAGVAGLSNEVPDRKQAFDWARR